MRQHHRPVESPRPRRKRRHSLARDVRQESQQEPIQVVQRRLHWPCRERDARAHARESPPQPDLSRTGNQRPQPVESADQCAPEWPCATTFADTLITLAPKTDNHVVRIEGDEDVSDGVLPDGCQGVACLIARPAAPGSTRKTARSATVYSDRPAADGRRASSTQPPLVTILAVLLEPRPKECAVCNGRGKTLNRLNPVRERRVVVGRFCA